MENHDMINQRGAAGSGLFFAGSTPNRLSDDILRGAGQIASFLFNDVSYRRRIYDLTDGGMLPVFRIGKTICARKSTLMQWIATQEGFKVEEVGQ